MREIKAEDINNVVHLSVGINYPGTKNSLRGCINDVIAVNKMIESSCAAHRYKLHNIILRDDNLYDKTHWPTKDNIINALRKVAAEYGPGTIFIFQVSGHGTQVKDLNGDEADGLDEAIVTHEANSALGYIIDDELHELIRAIGDKGVKTIAIIDACHSGTVLDLGGAYMSGEKYYNGPASIPLKDKFVGRSGSVELHPSTTNKNALLMKYENTVGRVVVWGHFFPFQHNDAVAGNNIIPMAQHEEKETVTVLYSGCRDKRTSADTMINGTYRGLMTCALENAISVLAGNDFISFALGSLNGSHEHYNSNMRNWIAKQGFSQQPQTTVYAKKVFNSTLQATRIGEHPCTQQLNEQPLPNRHLSFPPKVISALQEHYGKNPTSLALQEKKELPGFLRQLPEERRSGETMQDFSRPHQHSSGYQDYSEGPALHNKYNSMTAYYSGPSQPSNTFNQAARRKSCTANLHYNSADNPNSVGHYNNIINSSSSTLAYTNIPTSESVIKQGATSSFSPRPQT